MAMGSMMMSGMASATSMVMDAMATATTTSGHNHMSMSMDMLSATSTGSSMMDMDSMHMGSMHMYFTTQFKDYPVLFKGLTAHTKAQAFGIFVLLFFVAFVARSFDFIRNYMEFKVWHNPTYFNVPENNFHAAKQNMSDSKDSEVSEHSLEPVNSSGLSLSASLFRDAIRLALSIIPEILFFALMLAVMTYTLTYFFAVVLGSGIGRFAFDKLSYRMGIRPSAGSAH
jgi:copper transporter 1